MKDRLGPGTLFCNTPPARFARTGSTIATKTVPNKINIGILPVSRPVLLKILKKHIPIRLNMVYFKITQRKGKPMIDAHKRSHTLIQPATEPFSYTSSRPVLAGAGRRQHLNGSVHPVGLIYPQPLKA